VKLEQPFQAEQMIRSISRSLPLSSNSVRDIRRFLDDHLEDPPHAGEVAAIADLAAESAVRAGGSAATVRVTLRIHQDHVEVSVSRAGAPAGSREPVRFGVWLAAALRREGISQEAAARRIGVSLKTVNRWVRGHNEPRLREFRQVREVFGEPPLD
jgi:hypothetical protein